MHQIISTKTVAKKCKKIDALDVMVRSHRTLQCECFTSNARWMTTKTLINPIASHCQSGAKFVPDLHTVPHRRRP
jgi:hypothetical protein